MVPVVSFVLGGRMGGRMDERVFGYDFPLFGRWMYAGK